MAQILVRNLDDKLVRILKERAARSGRSLQAEITLILRAAARSPVLSREEALEKVLAMKLKLKGRDFPDSTALIREDRDG
jgi:plasmid stability protein